MIYIVTPCTRPFNLARMRASIPANCKWIISYDSSVKSPVPVDGATVIFSKNTGHFGNPVRNTALDYLASVATDDDWLYILDDDNIVHPDWYDAVSSHLQSSSMIGWDQEFPSGGTRAIIPDAPGNGNVDTAQYMMRWGAVKNIRYELLYEADGIYAEQAFKAAGGITKIHKNICYYNYLRRNKLGNRLWAKICMISMFKNEANNIRRMLDSVAPYIDYWVLQDNGSTDGTPEVVKKWAEETGIPGTLYQVEEGWVNFGWNRDHLLQKTLSMDHACDWIMKMDCDEILEVEEDFDWKPFFEKPKHESFHVTAVNPGTIYFRAWIWDANLPWAFNHDPAHETIYLTNGRGENFERHGLDKKFRMVCDGKNWGESYAVPTKYISDALKLEEKMIRDGNMLQDLYHFWYIGKSYEDCYRGNFFPLGELHQNEYAKRCIFYYENVVKVGNGGTLEATGINEMHYYALCGVGNAYRFLKEHSKAIEAYNKAIAFCPRRNDHLIYLAEIHWELRDYGKMLEYTTQLMDPARTVPFPDYFFLINTNMYYDGGNYPSYLHNIAKENAGKDPFRLASKPKKRIFVVDNFYDDPYAVRQFALEQQFEDHSDWYKGRRTYERFLQPQVKRAFEEIMGHKITEWESHGMNGKFQYCVPENPLVFHYDSQTWAALIYLTPDAPFSTGTNLYAHRNTKIRHIDEDPRADTCFSGGFYDSTKFELVDVVGNVFNRLVIFDARSFHAAAGYFGKNITDSRLFQIFFFD